MNVFFSRAAQQNIDETSTDVEADIAAIRDGSMTHEQLMAHCLDGADPNRHQGWVDYVNEISRATLAADGRVHETLSLPAQTKREQVETVLRARGLVEVAPGIWCGTGAYVRLDIAHSPETAWLNRIYNGVEMPRETLTYDEVTARFE